MFAKFVVGWVEKHDMDVAVYRIWGVPGGLRKLQPSFFGYHVCSEDNNLETTAADRSGLRETMLVMLH